MNIVIYPYKMGSAGAKALAERLDSRRVFPDRAYRNRHDDMIVNWGASQVPLWTTNKWLNTPYSVRIAGNKLTTFEALVDSGVTPRFTKDRDAAVKLFDEEGVERVYCRTKLTGHSGEGIVIAENKEQLVDAPLYVQGISGLRDEYRVHVFDNEIIDVQMKRKRRGFEGVNTLVRNHHNGYVYCRGDIPDLPHTAQLDCKFAVMSLGLIFGAVDVVIMRDNPDKHYILEVNTAPGLEGTTLDKYEEAVLKYKEEHYG